MIASGYITYAFAAIVFFTIYMSILHSFKRDKLKDRIKSVGMVGEDEVDHTSIVAEICRAVLSLFRIDINRQPELATEMIRSGIQSTNAVLYFLFFKRIMQPLLLVLSIYLFGIIITSPQMDGLLKLQYAIMTIVLGITGISGSTLYLDHRRRKYQEVLAQSVPEAMDLMLICIESGLALDAALNRVCNELKFTHPELVRELDRTRIELNVLNDRVQALQNLADRTAIMPMRSLVAAIIQTEKFGTSLVETLRVLAEDQRESRMLMIEQKAARIPVLITMPLIICILPSLFIIILGPTILNINEAGGIGALLGGGR